MTDQTTADRGPEYTPCGCGHIEPEHEPNGGECYSCDCATYRPASAVPLPPADQTALRDRIAEALIAWTYRGKGPEHGGILETVRANAYSRADAVLAVLPATTDRAAVRAAAFRDAANGAHLNVHSSAAEGVRRWLLALADAELRRVAAETAAAETQATTLSPTERTMLDYALNQAQLRMWDTGKYTAEEQAALVSLRRLTTEQPAAKCSCGVLRTGLGRHLPECPNGPAAGARQDGAQPS
ncbi:hypothetical protein [Streptomyces sp. SID5910]|uniref:hypothetical protein n=1 Tax=Streptomyces sp. SID5910 TaxID=2690312 RepID=UPI00137081D8|nr:hypothetical protein [Streptomyces sp. SID5910]MYR46769.1 hypothetical protein [Streptomyces sp. SID5910]